MLEPIEQRLLMASIVVNSTADTIKNDGVTTLREAITAANGTTASDVITFNLGSGAHTIDLGSALPTVTRPVQINGPGASLLTLRRSGTSNYRIFRTASGVVISGVTISNARVNDSLGGAVFNEATLTMNDCVISGNAEIAGVGCVGGGGIVNYDTLTLNRCTVSNNTSIGGAGLVNLGAVTVTECTFSGNQATGFATYDNRGGAIYNYAGAQLTLTRSTIAGNTAVLLGGGLYNLGAASVTGCTFVDNTADQGGAIYQHSQTPMTVSNSTFTRNTATYGAAIANPFEMTLVGCTITGNPGSRAAVECYYAGTPVTTLRNSIVALNGSGDDILGTFLLSDNFIGSSRSILDDYGRDPMLGPLADNGGATQTMAPLPGSPVINVGNNTFASTEDQRGAGFSRVSGAKVDLGAYEAQSVTVDNIGDASDGNYSAHNLTLREAIEMANADPHIDNIRFADEVFSTHQTIDTAGLTVSGELDVRGPGAKLLTIRGQAGQADVFDTNTNLYLADLTVQNRGQGAAIDNHNVLSLRHVVVSGTTSSGPGVVTSGKSTIKYSTLMDNAGGGMISLGGSATVYDCTLSRNSTAIRNDSGSLALTYVTIGANSGEGVRNAGTLTARHTLIALNSAGDVVNTGAGTADLSYFDFIGTRDGDPMLMPLADNGGSTPTMALRPYSPCINRGGAASPIVLDQRGTPRSRFYDIGAYEYAGPFNNSLVVNTTADEDNGSADPGYGTGTSLREALWYARQTAGPDVITFALGSSPQVIQLASDELDVTTGITIRGPGADLLTIRGPGLTGYGVLNISQSFVTPSVGPVEVSGMTLTNGKSRGIAIIGAWDVRVIDCVITGNGNGIYNSGGQLTLSRSTIRGNSTSYGGGIYSYGSLHIDSSTISGNSAGSRGGGIYLNGGTATITQSTISGNSVNTAGGEGGAIYLFGGTMTISRSTVANNSGGSTGGILNNAGNLTLSNTIVAKNTGGDLGTTGTTTYSATSSFIGDTQGDPHLGPLADNGGPTQTMALLPGSPCINAGNNTAAPGNDQRGTGYGRIVNGVVDIGAFEVQAIKTWIGPASGGNWSTATNWSPSGAPAASDDVLISGGSVVNLNGSATVGTLTLTGGAALNVAAAGNRVLRTSTLAIAAGSTLNLNDNDLIIDYAGSGTPLAGVVSGIIDGRGAGSGGAGIYSPQANDSGELCVLGVGEAREVLGIDGSETATFSGQTVDATCLLVKFTYAGDANLDGLIDAADYGVIDYLIQFPGASGYFNGDFNYDGVIDAGDYGILDYNIQVQGPPLS